MIRVKLTSVWVDDQAAALAFYTEKLGFIKKTDVPAGDARWLTVVSPADPDGIELLLEPTGHPAAGPLKEALVEGLGRKPRQAFGPVRVAVSGRTVSPPLYESMELLGRERTLSRLTAARSTVPG